MGHFSQILRCFLAAAPAAALLLAGCPASQAPAPDEMTAQAAIESTPERIRKEAAKTTRRLIAGSNEPLIP